MTAEPPLVIGRYALYDRIAAGGMATVFIGRLVGPVGFARTVAIKRLHPQFASDPDFVSMFLDEARLAARIQHPNVVATLDVVATMGELFLVMDYVRGESVSALVRYAKRDNEKIPPRIAAAIVSGALQGLHAAHVATDEAGKPLGIVHRDVSPQNVLVGVDGTPRVLDFGVAKAANRLHTTRGGEIKGKISYMPPEQLEGLAVDRTADIYAMGLLLFEVVTGERMFLGVEEVSSLAKILRNEISLPSARDAALGPWDAVVRKATAKDPKERYSTARAMALDVERVFGVASSVEVADFVEHLAGKAIEERSRRVAEIESQSGAFRSSEQAALVKEINESGPTLADEITVEADVMDTAIERSQVSALSQAVSVRGAAATRKRWPIFALVGAVAALALGVVVVVATKSSASSPVVAAAASSPKAPESPAPEPAPSATASEPTPSKPSAEEVAPTATSSARPAATTPPAPPRPRAAPAAKPGGKPNCERPTTVDSAGHVHFRPECL
jgi:serine/threonine-protein kinase